LEASRQVKTPGLFVHAAKSGIGNGQRDQIDRAGYKKHAAPPKQVADYARSGRSQQVSAHGSKEQAANGHLPLLHRNAVAGNSQRNWKDASRCNPRNDAQCHERFEVRREAACKRGNADNKHADGDQPRLAEHIRKRTKHRLNECVRQGETG
jgi:hypothetical protein